MMLLFWLEEMPEIKLKMKKSSSKQSGLGAASDKLSLL
jgi:hypothetical protein